MISRWQIWESVKALRMYLQYPVLGLSAYFAPDWSNIPVRLSKVKLYQWNRLLIPYKTDLKS